jgi:hypothetical protein
MCIQGALTERVAAYARDLESEREALEEQLEESRNAIPVIKEVYLKLPCLSSLSLLKGTAILLYTGP